MSNNLQNNMEDNFQPFPHQLDAMPVIEKMEKQGGLILADEMGCGKTLTTAMYLRTHKESRPNLIVVPSSTLLYVWQREILRVKDWPEAGPEPSILLYHGKDRKEQLKSQKWDYVLTTYSVLSKNELNTRMWSRVCLDESHTIRNGTSSKKPKCALSSYAVAKRAKYRWCITGTPFNNRIGDIASQCKFIGAEPYNDPQWWVKNETNEVAKERWCKDFMLRRTKEGKLKPPTYHDITVTPTECETGLVDALRAKAAQDFAKWRHCKGVDKSVLQMKLMALISTLRLFSNSFYAKQIIDSKGKGKGKGKDGKGKVDMKVEDIIQDCGKVKRIVDDLKVHVEADDKKGVVVFSQFTSFLSVLEKVISSELSDVKIYQFTGETTESQRDGIVNEFNESREPRVMLISLMAGGVGLSSRFWNPLNVRTILQPIHRKTGRRSDTPPWSRIRCTHLPLQCGKQRRNLG